MNILSSQKRNKNWYINFRVKKILLIPLGMREHNCDILRHSHPPSYVRRAHSGIQNVVIIYIHKTETQSLTKRYTKAYSGIQNTVIIYIHKTETWSSPKRYTEGLQWYTEYCNHLFTFIKLRHGHPLAPSIPRAKNGIQNIIIIHIYP